MAGTTTEKERVRGQKTHQRGVSSGNSTVGFYTARKKGGGNCQPHKGLGLKENHKKEPP